MRKINSIRTEILIKINEELIEVNKNLEALILILSKGK